LGRILSFERNHPGNKVRSLISYKTCGDLNNGKQDNLRERIDRERLHRRLAEDDDSHQANRWQEPQRIVQFVQQLKQHAL
jgi:hypothetical protein